MTSFFSGTAVIVFHNLFWRRGTIINENSVFLVDFGKSIKLVKKKYFTINNVKKTVN